MALERVGGLPSRAESRVGIGAEDSSGRRVLCVPVSVGMKYPDPAALPQGSGGS